MNMKFRKITGWGLLVLGLLIIFYSLYSSYQIFSGTKQAPEIFSLSEEVPQAKTEKESGMIPFITEHLEEIMSQEMAEILPVQHFSKLLNLVSWSIWAGILIFGGGAIASLGIKLIVTK